MLIRFGRGRIDFIESEGDPHGATALAPAPAPAHLQGVSRNKDAALIPAEKIGPDPTQPREEFDPDELAKLAESLRTRGQLQPITVFWEEGRRLYVIVCGERRWRAAKLAGIPTMTATIRARAPGDGERLAPRCIENLPRTDLRPVEEAKSYRQLMTLNGWSAAQLSRELSVSESKIARAMALLGLPASVQTQLEGESCPRQRRTKPRRSRTRPSEPCSPTAWFARSSRARTPPGSSGSGSSRGGAEGEARRPRRPGRRVRDGARQGERRRRRGRGRRRPGGCPGPGPRGWPGEARSEC